MTLNLVPLQIDLFEARAARDAGRDRVEGHADEEWKAGYRICADSFLLVRETGDTFIGEDLRIYARATGLGEPHHPNAWSAMAGGTLRRWRREGLIVPDDMAQAHSVASHAHHYRRYRVTL